MELTVFWTKIAENKLESIFNYYKTKAGIRIAQKLTTGITNKTISLKQTPYLGQEEPLRIKFPQEFRYLIFKNYKIIYWINDKKQRL